jgi:putative flippase GtrA
MLSFFSSSHFVQLLRYIGVAVGSLVSDWLAFFLLYQLLQADYLIAQTIARLAGGGFSFFTNKYWSFKANKDRPIVVEARRFLLLYLVSFGLNLLILTFLTEQLEGSTYWSKLGSDSFCFIFNFLVMGHYVFDAREPDAPDLPWLSQTKGGGE